jgi:hypothetical protein
MPDDYFRPVLAMDAGVFPAVLRAGRPIAGLRSTAPPGRGLF